MSVVSTADRRADGFASDTAIMVFGDDLRIVCWNEGAERLTGTPAAEAIGRACWEVVAGHDDRGDLVCHERCSRARLMREGHVVPTAHLHARTPGGRRRLSFETISSRTEYGPLYLHVIHDAPASASEHHPEPEGELPELTARQREILALLAEGKVVKSVARDLGLMESTVRNHVRHLLRTLGAHSQLQAVARARALGILP